MFLLVRMRGSEKKMKEKKRGAKKKAGWGERGEESGEGDESSRPDIKVHFASCHK